MEQISNDKLMDKFIGEYHRNEHQRWLGNMDYERKMRDWSIDVARREAFRNAKIESDHMKVVPPGAVYLKPEW